MVVLHIIILLLIVILSDVIFGTDKYQDLLLRANLDWKPLNCKSCLTFWLTFVYSWIFLFPLSWALVVGFVFFYFSIEGYTEQVAEWIIKSLKK